MDCILCIEKIELIARYTCNHTICHKCATKLIFLYDDKKCPLCKSENGKLIFESIGKKYNKVEKIVDKDVIYDNKIIFDKIKGLLLKKCVKCKIVLESNKDLINHYKIRHSLILCDVCINNEHEFWYEHTIYNTKNLIKHQKGKLNQPGFSGHIFCPHCKLYLYDYDKAKYHARNKHQLCTVCVSIGINNQFYNDYKSLEIHYRAKHFLCHDSVCIKNHSYVFAYQSELWIHLKNKHLKNFELTEIKNGLCEDSIVFSLLINNDLDVEIENNNNNIINPLINKPYFPTFLELNTKTTEIKDEKNKKVNNELITINNIPKYMNREILKQENHIIKTRIQQINLFTNKFVDKINEIISKYIEGNKSINNMVKEIESYIGNKICLLILKNISFLNKNDEVKKFLKNYIINVTFPNFKKEEKDKIIKPEINKNRFLNKFKVLDISKKKN